MYNKFYITKNGRDLAFVSFSMEGLPNNCSTKVLSYINVSVEEGSLTKTDNLVVSKIIAKMAFDPYKTGCTMYTHPGHDSLRKRIIATSSLSRSTGYFTEKFIKCLGIQAGGVGEGGHGNYGMILGILEKGEHANMPIPEQYSYRGA